MNEKTDISSREDILTFIKRFYERAKTDPVIGFIFTEVVQMDWDHHIPVIADFWESILLDNPVYRKNAMEVHYSLDKKVPLVPEYFDTWIRLFSEAVDESFEGKIADLAKKRAASIAGLMQHKIQEQKNKIEPGKG